MKYVSPLFEGKEQFVPIVAKNVDELVGFLRGSASFLEIMEETLTSIGLPKCDLGVNDAELMDLSSSNYNDVLEDGRRESLLSKKERKEYAEGLLETAIDMVDVKMIDNPNTDNVLNISCLCNFGFYSWKEYKDLPKDSVVCADCGRTLIHYTDHNHYEYDYDEAIKGLK